MRLSFILASLHVIISPIVVYFGYYVKRFANVSGWVLLTTGCLLAVFSCLYHVQFILLFLYNQFIFRGIHPELFQFTKGAVKVPHFLLLVCPITYTYFVIGGEILKRYEPKELQKDVPLQNVVTLK
ncbi:hypothetical protein RF11_00574 [Thelohanellus kitauei]|uniref:Uncharacterized protein n=1 Tax=Thelohanellus kitauei TaxID=669202 RepID=A0A0C2ND26_THEKT|nr:hypothetical protein RF11_00574 [Thelohanellus kitauei]